LISPSPTPPYTTWQTAAQTIQAAVDVCASGDVVMVTNGVYAVGGAPVPGAALPARVMANKAITIRSVNGPRATVIYGQGPLGFAATRCVYLSNHAALIGFTLSNGFTRTDGDLLYDRCGGGVFLDRSSFVSNCVITRCDAYLYGGGALLNYGGQLVDSTFFANTASNYGGGAACIGGGVLDGCTLAGNNAGDWGGAFYTSGSASASRCEVYFNRADDGGGAYLNGGSVQNSLFYLNRAAQDGGGVFVNGAASVLLNSTAADNYATRYGGGVLIRLGGSNINSIIYHNMAGTSGSNYHIATSGHLAFCCTAPLPAGMGNISSDPQFHDRAAYDYHLLSPSPCINNGNNTLAAGTLDLDGRQRILGTPIQLVDMGCYEAVPQDASAATRHVSLGGGNTWPYSSSFSAARTIQDAIDAAQPGDTIEIAGGVYDRGYRGAYGARNRILLTKNLTLAGNKPDPDVTVIAGAADLFTSGPGTTAVRCAYLGTGTLRDLMLHGGCTRAPGSFLQSIGGGAILEGGGTLSNCIISDCRASSGAGGVFCESGGTLIQTRIYNNHGVQAGGGLVCNAGGWIHNCIISNNTSDRGAGAYLMSNPIVRRRAGAVAGSGDAVIDHCLVTRNQADTSGGGVYILGAGTVQYSHLLNNGCYGYGGGLYIESGGLAAYTVFERNATIEAGGGVYFYSGGEVMNSLLVSNTAINGGGAYFHNRGVLDSCTLAHNSAVHGGGGVYCQNGGTNRNCIIYGNYPLVSGESNIFATGTGPAFYYCFSALLPPGVYNTAGNLAGDPLFVNAPLGDFRLLESSPCIDAGTNLPWMAGALDLDGNPRIHDGTVDMGCYEFIPEPCGMAVLTALAAFLLRDRTHRSDRSDPSN